MLSWREKHRCYSGDADGFHLNFSVFSSLDIKTIVFSHFRFLQKQVRINYWALTLLFKGYLITLSILPLLKTPLNNPHLYLLLCRANTVTSMQQQYQCTVDGFSLVGSICRSVLEVTILNNQLIVLKNKSRHRHL